MAENFSNFSKSYLNTTITSSGLSIVVDDGSLFPASNFFIVIDPENAAREIVWVSSRSTNTLTVPATAQRGQGGTTAGAHGKGAKVVHTILKGHTDTLLNTVDNPSGFGLDLGFDYEFNASSSSLPSGWSWVNQSTCTYAEAYGAGKITVPASGGVHTRGIFRSVSGTSWTATAKIAHSFPSADTFGVLLMMRQSSNTHVAGLRYYGSYLADVITATDDDWSSVAVIGSAVQANFIPGYWRITKNSSTSYDFAISSDGITWLTVVAGNNMSAHITPDQIGFCAYSQTGTRDIACHWLRVR